MLRRCSRCVAGKGSPLLSSIHMREALLYDWAIGKRFCSIDSKEQSSAAPTEGINDKRTSILIRRKKKKKEKLIQLPRLKLGRDEGRQVVPRGYWKDKQNIMNALVRAEQILGIEKVCIYQKSVKRP